MLFYLIQEDQRITYGPMMPVFFLPIQYTKIIFFLMPPDQHILQLIEENNNNPEILFIDTDKHVATPITFVY